MTIQEVLHTIQKKLSVPKNRWNSFGYYKYRSCEDIVEGVKELLPEGYVLTLKDEILLIGDRFYIKAEATLRGESASISSYGYAREALSKKGMDESQVTGTASSYARKYALNGLFAIDDGNDADSIEEAPKVSKAPKKELTPEEKKKLAQGEADRIVYEINKAIDSDALYLIEKNNEKSMLALQSRYPEIFAGVEEVLKLKGVELS